MNESNTNPNLEGLPPRETNSNNSGKKNEKSFKKFVKEHKDDLWRFFLLIATLLN